MPGFCQGRQFFEDRLLRRTAHDLIAHFAAAEKEQRGNCTHTKALHERGLIVDVHFCDPKSPVDDGQESSFTRAIPKAFASRP